MVSTGIQLLVHRRVITCCGHANWQKQCVFASAQLDLCHSKPGGLPGPGLGASDSLLRRRRRLWPGPVSSHFAVLSFCAKSAWAWTLVAIRRQDIGPDTLAFEARWPSRGSLTSLLWRCRSPPLALARESRHTRIFAEEDNTSRMLSVAANDSLCPVLPFPLNTCIGICMVVLPTPSTPLLLIHEGKDRQDHFCRTAVGKAPSAAFPRNGRAGSSLAALAALRAFK